MLALRHVHHKKLRRFPKKYSFTILDHIIYMIAFIGPFMTIPQIYDIWVARKPSVNLITWGSGLVFGVIWLFYGIVHKEKPIIFSNILGIIATSLVVAGAVLYR